VISPAPENASGTAKLTEGALAGLLAAGASLTGYPPLTGKDRRGWLKNS